MSPILSQLFCCRGPSTLTLFPSHAAPLSTCQPPRAFHATLSDFLYLALYPALCSACVQEITHTVRTCTSCGLWRFDWGQICFFWHDRSYINFMKVFRTEKTDLFCLSASSFPLLFSISGANVNKCQQSHHPPSPPTISTRLVDDLLLTGRGLLSWYSGLRGMLLRFTTDVFSDPDKTTHRDEEKSAIAALSWPTAHMSVTCEWRIISNTGEKARIHRQPRKDLI